ncbi:MAG: hypothetical protein SFU86_03705, partial [Pirellulaceae bacterium]|nr:hypothetical protein [Pirellulaceae bacterium]
MHVASGSLVVLALLLGQAANPAAEQIAGWVKQLGDDDFAVRQAASDALWQAGAAAIPALAEAVRSPDAETAYRAKALLDKVRVGIRPNTPPELAALIDQFRFGSDSAQRTALAELRTKGQWPIVLALLRSEANLDRRRTLAQAVAPDAGKVIRPLLEKGQLDDAQAILELTAVQDPGQIQLNTFLLLTGRLESAVAELARQQATSPQPEDWRRLALMSRAAGNMPAAIAAAEKSSDKYLLLNLLSEARDWPRAAAVMVELAQANPTATDHAAFLATFQRLAENPAGYAEALKTLQRPPAPDPFAPAPAVPLPTSWAYAETLLINEQPTEAIIALLDSAPERAAMLLRQRHQVDRLLELAKVKNDAAFDGAWLASLPAAPGDARLQAR